jgi:Fur family ferric uptake transcriptional regulator
MEGKDLRKVGLKVTLPRLKILEILERSATRHLSAEEIYKSLIGSAEDIGLATVYRVLTQFEAAGLVTRHHFEDGMAVFELNQGAHHDHIVCMDCGHVEEFVDTEIESRQDPWLHDQRALADSLRALWSHRLPAPQGGGGAAQLAGRAAASPGRGSAGRDGGLG